MPVRCVIHSSEVVKHRASRWLSTTQSGTAIPVPMILAFFISAFRRGDCRLPYYSPRRTVKERNGARRQGLAAVSWTAEARGPLLEEGSQALAVILRFDHQPLRQPLPGQARLEVDGQGAVVVPAIVPPLRPVFPLKRETQPCRRVDAWALRQKIDKKLTR